MTKTISFENLNIWILNLFRASNFVLCAFCYRFTFFALTFQFFQDGIEHAINKRRRFIGTELFGKLDCLIYYNFGRDIRAEFQLINRQSQDAFVNR